MKDVLAELMLESGALKKARSALGRRRMRYQGIVRNFAHGTITNFVRDWAVEQDQVITLVKRSRKRTANWAVDMDYSRGGVIHSFSFSFSFSFTATSTLTRRS